MKILVVGSGGREHAICQSFSKSEKVTKIFCADGNAGIADVAQCIDIKPHEIERLAEFAVENAIDLTFVGGETALALGITDEFEKRDIKIIGASKQAALLESSKAFAKDFMLRHKIPTAKYKTADSPAEAVEILRSGLFGDENSPVVVKADGLAAGKGVVVAVNRNEAENAVNELKAVVGERATAKIVLEECLVGREVSLLMFADGENFALMPPVRDHKRIGENDTGANTGGMGTVSGSNLLSESELEQIIAEIVIPTLKGARDENFPFRGILFLGLMMTADGAQLLEYNVRFGDPETQVILVRLKTELVDICKAMLSQSLDHLNIEWQSGSSACVVLAAKNYPQTPQTGDVIFGLDKLREQKDVQVFHAGTTRNKNGDFVTAGGRVLGVTTIAESLDEALRKAYQAVEQISFNGMQYRRDIGK